ncbi:MAG: hypothetical protein ACREUM_08795 [Nitrosospira sp.]
MRIMITGEKSVIDDLGAALDRDKALGEPVEASADGTELRLGLLEAAAIIAIVVNIATLIKYLIELARHLKEGQKRQLEIKTAAATTLVEINNKSTPEALEKQLSALAASGAASAPTSDAPDKKV